MQKSPHGTTHVEEDGTAWRNENGDWFYWVKNFGWQPYVGAKTKSFLAKFRVV